MTEPLALQNFHMTYHLQDCRPPDTLATLQDELERLTQRVEQLEAQLAEPRLGYPDIALPTLLPGIMIPAYVVDSNYW